MKCLCLIQKQELSDLQDCIRSNKHDGLKVSKSLLENSLCAPPNPPPAVFVWRSKRSCIAVSGTPSHSYRMSLVIRDHTVLPATRHKWAHPALTPALQVGTQFTYPRGMDGWVDLGDRLHAETVTHPSTNPAVHSQESNSQPVDHKSHALTTAPSGQQCVEWVSKWFI